MFRRLTAALVVAILGAFPHAGVLADETVAPPAAVLMACGGPVTVVRADGEQSAGAFGLALHAGDRVKTGKEARAEIMFEDGTWVEIGANSGMQIKSRPGSPAPRASQEPGEKTFEVVQNFVRLKNAEGTSVLTGLRSADKKPELVVLAPRQTKIREALPEFHWETADPSAELRLVVYTDQGVHWEGEISGATSLRYPSDAPALAPGTSYSWTLETTDPLRFPPLRTPAAFFEVMSPEEATMLDEALATIDAEKTPSQTAYHLTRASILFDRGLLDDAIDETHAALASDPENAALHAILARLYAETGQAEQALAEMDKASAAR